MDGLQSTSSQEDIGEGFPGNQVSRIQKHNASHVSMSDALSNHAYGSLSRDSSHASTIAGNSKPESLSPEDLILEFWGQHDIAIQKLMISNYEAIMGQTVDELSSTEKLDVDEEYQHALGIEKAFVARVIESYAAWSRKEEETKIVLWDIDDTMVISFSDGRTLYRPSLVLLLRFLKSHFPHMQNGILSNRTKESVIAQFGGSLQFPLDQIAPYFHTEHVYSSRGVGESLFQSDQLADARFLVNFSRENDLPVGNTRVAAVESGTNMTAADVFEAYLEDHRDFNSALGEYLDHIADNMLTGEDHRLPDRDAADKYLTLAKLRYMHPGTIFFVVDDNSIGYLEGVNGCYVYNCTPQFEFAGASLPQEAGISQN